MSGGRAVSGAWVAIHPAERETLALLREQGADMAAGDLAWLRPSGVPDDVAADLSMQSGDGHPFARMVDPDRLLEHGDLVPLAGRQLRAAWTRGHTPGHLCLHDEAENLLLTGEHVLPRISPNIGLQPHAAEPPLAAYLRSLESEPLTTALRRSRRTSTASRASRAGFACCSRTMNVVAKR
jgi:glyoxylase-like metal-dependent hydrolase (beta-lactamase superfamily II)